MGTLSEGQAQKVSILLSLGHEPELLILDEPVASLDPLARRQFLKMILELVADRQCTVFFSTHITSDLERVADQVAILNEGVISFSGELEELKDMVKRLRVIGVAPDPQDIGIGGLIHYEKANGDAIITVRDFCPEMKERLSRQFGVDVQVESLNLEEIFLEMSR
jgi:ABC-2 type transport system ATP-binding protein